MKTIVDVRTPGEYAGGHVPGSINIPLHQVPDRLAEFRTMPQPIVLCCASGGRSSQATHWLRAQGVDCENGGSWMSID